MSSNWIRSTKNLCAPFFFLACLLIFFQNCDNRFSSSESDQTSFSLGAEGRENFPYETVALPNGDDNFIDAVYKEVANPSSKTLVPFTYDKKNLSISFHLDLPADLLILFSNPSTETPETQLSKGHPSALAKLSAFPFFNRNGADYYSLSSQTESSSGLTGFKFGEGRHEFQMPNHAIENIYIIRLASLSVPPGDEDPKDDKDPGSETDPTEPTSTGVNQGRIGTAVRTIEVSNVSQLTAALSNARAGDHIRLANGTYAGTFSTSSAGTASAPIVIKSANFLKATLSGRIILKHGFNVVYGLTFATPQVDGNVLIDADDSRVIRNNFPNIGARGVKVERNQRKRFEIAYNYFRGGANPIQILITPNGTQALKGWVHHNHLKGCSGSSIEQGTSERHSAVPVEMLTEYNLIEECGNNTALGFKCSKSVMFRNTLRNCGNANLQSRSGRNNKFIANSSIGGGGVLLRGEGHLAIGNYKDNAFTGAWNDHTSPAGTMEQAQFEKGGFTGTQWASGNSTLWIGNIPHVRIGGGSSEQSVFPRNNRVESAKGSAGWLLVSGRNINTTTSATQSMPVPTYRILLPADVGPNAGPVGPSWKDF